MRCDQYIGLPQLAHDFLHQYRLRNCCPTCGVDLKKFSSPLGEFEGAYGTVYPLMRYHLLGGLLADEFVQASPWSSGPCFFIGLRVSDGTEYLWSDEEIDEYLR